MQSHTGQPYCTAGMAMMTPAAPIIEPIERSNSPPIISMQAATAMIPSCAETSRKLITPSAVNMPLPRATKAKKMNTRMVPATAPSSGRAMALRIQGVRCRRSSTVGAVVAGTSSSPRIGERNRPRDGAPPGAGRAPSRGGRLADALLAQLDHLGGVVRRDEAGAGHHRASRHDAVLRVLLQQHDRQIALEELLLVNGERHLTVGERLE